LDLLARSQTNFQYFRRLLEIDAKAAKLEAFEWRNSKSPIATHIRIWSIGDVRLATRADIGAVFRTISRAEFWNESHQRDLLVLLERRWNELTSQTRRSIERRLLRGRKRWKGESIKEFKQRRASAILSRVHYLSSKGCAFSFDVGAVTEELRKDYPEWRSEWSAKAALSTGMRSGWVKTDIRSDDLLDRPLGRSVRCGGQIVWQIAR
jgi:hypothetical protein